MIVPGAFTMPEVRFTWPGVIMIMTPTPMKTEFLDAGCLFKAEHLPSLHLSLEVTRGQFSDMLLMLEAGRSAAYLFLEYWPIERVDYAGMTGLPGVCGPGTCRAGTTVAAPNTCFS
jgi:hypothetical protein